MNRKINRIRDRSRNKTLILCESYRVSESRRLKYISLQCRLSETSASCSFEVEKAYPVQKPHDEMLGKAITRETKSTITNEDFKKEKKGR